MKHRSERDYIDRTIATVRNHRDADNCWPSWANIFADEIEDLRADLERVVDRAARSIAAHEYDTGQLLEGGDWVPEEDVERAKRWILDGEESG